MALPETGKLGDPASTTAEFQARIEALRDAVAALQTDLDAAESNVLDINSVLSDKLEASDLQDYAKIPDSANGTLVWSGSATTIPAANFSGGLIAGHYIVETDGGRKVSWHVTNPLYSQWFFLECIALNGLYVTFLVIQGGAVNPGMSAITSYYSTQSQSSGGQQTTNITKIWRL